MRTILIFHEVDNVEHWLASPRRREIFGPLGITARTFVDPEQSNRVGLIVEVPSMEALEEAMGTSRLAEGMTFDGVRAETVQILTEG
jgi:hypothetical protein